MQNGPHDPEREPKVEILPADPRWRQARPSVVYEVDPSDGALPSEPHTVRRVETAPPRPLVLSQLWKVAKRFAMFVALALFAVWLFEPLGPEPLARATVLLRDAGWIGKGIVVLSVAALVPTLVPVGPLAIVPGYVWGTVEGTALAILGAVLGGLLNLWISRRFLGPHVQAWVGTSELLASLADTIDARGLRILLGLRLSPVMPYGLLSYLTGVTRIAWWRFALAAAVGGIPWTSVYGMAGAMMAESARAVSLDGVVASPETTWLRWIGLGFTVLVAVWIGRVARADLTRNRAMRRPG
jgi:uncharacterized membrane protein YdjX (TVP38/TMEM64 family)